MGELRVLDGQVDRAEFPAASPQLLLLVRTNIAQGTADPQLVRRRAPFVD